MMHAFRISECYLDFSCMDAIGPLNLAVFRTDEIHRHNSRPQLCKPINLLQFIRAAQLSYRLNRWNVRLRNVRLTSTRYKIARDRPASKVAKIEELFRIAAVGCRMMDIKWFAACDPLCDECMVSQSLC